ncbi:hypothetical protein D1BOALGB6SA_29 [Olavius sp. associated proteobacterium Delta 1]|nr:hypothetical protein D1BOALGB6SA_29 [Olavius sp. associated proteobacterium Delta 1]
MNFLVVCTDFPPRIGGISTYTKELATALAKRGRVTVLAPGASHSASFDHACPFAIIRTPRVPLLRVAAFFVYIPWLVRRYHIGAILHTVWITALISHLWCRLMPVPYFISVYASEILDDQRNWRRRLKGYLKRWRQATFCRAKGIFPISKYTARIIMDFGIPEDKIQVIPCGVNPRRFMPAKSSKAAKGQKKLLTVARLDLHKGHDRILEALAILKEQGFSPRYLVVGEGEEEIRLRRMSQKLGLTEQVIFAGFIPENQLPKVYASADIFIMASREIPGRLDLIEGFGISFLEASASGLPLIAGRSGGVSDAVRDGETGILVNPNEPREIAEALRRLLNDNDFASRLGNEGRKWTVTQMNWDSVAERLERGIQTLM